MFNKQAACNRCDISVPKRELGIYDTTRQGRAKTGKIQKVCQKCMKELLYCTFESYDDKVLVFHPIKRLKAFVFYSFDELQNSNQKEHNQANEHLINDIKKLLPPGDTKCSYCEKQAQFAWSSPAVIYNDPFVWEIDKSAVDEIVHVCSACLIKLLEARIEAEQIRIKAFYPPIAGDGFFTSWEA